MLVYTREKIVAHLLGLSELNTLYMTQDAHYVPRSLQWMTEVEDSLRRLRLPLASTVAAARGKVVAVTDGYRAPSVQAGTNVRKAVKATTALALASIQEALCAHAENLDQRFEQLQEKIAQLLAVNSGATPLALQTKGQSRDAWIESTWSRLTRNDQTQAMVGYLMASLNHQDLMHLLGDTLDHLVENSHPSG